LESLKEKYNNKVQIMMTSGKLRFEELGLKNEKFKNFINNYTVNHSIGKNYEIVVEANPGSHFSAKLNSFFEDIKSNLLSILIV
jgi:hypothetical protein